MAPNQSPSLTGLLRHVSKLSMGLTVVIGLMEDPRWTFFNHIRGDLIDSIKRELTDLNSTRVQTITWIRFIKDDDRVELAFNSRMMNVHQDSDLDKIVDGTIAHMTTQIENPALLNSRFIFDEVLF